MADFNMELYRFLMNMNHLSDDRHFLPVNLNRGITSIMPCRFFDEKITDADRKQKVNAHAYYCKHVYVGAEKMALTSSQSQISSGQS